MVFHSLGAWMTTQLTLLRCVWRSGCAIVHLKRPGLNKHAPLKRKYVRANEAPFMTKELHKAIMKRSKLRKKFLRTQTNDDRAVQAAAKFM